MAMERGVHGVIANFETQPYHDVAKFQRYRRVAEDVKKITRGSDGSERSGCLRTTEQWSNFFDRVDRDAVTGNKPGAVRVTKRGLRWAALMGCVRGHREGLWMIPALSQGVVADKLAWINAHNDTGYEFTRTDWKNCGRKSRADNMPDMEFLLPKLAELGAIMPDGSPVC